MNRSEVRAELEKILAGVFGLGSVSLKDESTAKDFEKWDSLAHLDIILSVEERFGIRIPSTRAAKLENIGELVTLISEQKKW